jgi:hypothetical protein
MIRKILASSLLTLVIGASLATFPVQAEPYEAREFRSATQMAQAEAGRHGPFATARRANEVANYYRSRGYDAQVYSAWGDYFVNVW